MFQPSPALAEQVETTMKSLHLMPLQYSSVHLRAACEVPRKQGNRGTDIYIQTA